MSEPLLPGKVDGETQRTIGTLGREKQDAVHITFNRTPLPNDIPESGIAIANISGTVYLYTKVSGVLRRVALTNV